MRDVAMLITCCLLTVVMEFAFLYIIRIRDRRLWLSIPMNIVTNLSLNIFLIYFLMKKMPNTSIFYWLIVLGLEVVVVLVEGAFYQVVKKDKKNLLYSLLANLISGIYGSLILSLIFYFI